MDHKQINKHLLIFSHFTSTPSASSPHGCLLTTLTGYVLKEPTFCPCVKTARTTVSLISHIFLILPSRIAVRPGF
jgi:hypothetical protein